MISDAAFWLAILPPVLAVLVEYFNPINGSTVRASADRDLRADFGGLTPVNRGLLLGVIEQSGVALAEVSGLAPTLIASTTSGFAIIHELPSPFWPAIIYVLIFVVIALYLLWLLSGLTFAQIAGRDAAVPAPFTGGEISFGIKRAAVVSITIYVANTLLVILAMFVFSGKEEAKTTKLHDIHVSIWSPSLTAGEGGTEVQDPIFQYWVGEFSQQIKFRLDGLQDQLTHQDDQIVKLHELLTPLVSPPSPLVLPAVSLPSSESILGSLGWRHIQAALSRLGFNPGPIDGKPGARTRGAIREFQREEGNSTSTDGHLTPSEIAALWRGGGQCAP